MTQLSIVEFGDALLRTQDLDPVYVAIVASGLDYPKLCQLLLAYWCFYHLGAAARIAEAKTHKKFWQLVEEAAINETRPDGTKPWPRGAERRHFRAKNAIEPVADLISAYRTAEEAVQGLIGVQQSGGCDFAYITSHVQRHKGFGPWMAFKIADMVERVLKEPVDFSDCHLGIYKDPQQGAALAWAQTQWTDDKLPPRPWELKISDAELRETVDRLVRIFRNKKRKAPPHLDRLVNVQEIETILCKYKSHYKGHYPIGKDTFEVIHGLDGWGDLADQMSIPIRQLSGLHGGKEWLRRNK